MPIPVAVSGDKQLITRPKRGMRKKERDSLWQWTYPGRKNRQTRSAFNCLSHFKGWPPATGGAPLVLIADPVAREYFFVNIPFDASYRVKLLTFFLASSRISPLFGLGAFFNPLPLPPLQRGRVKNQASSNFVPLTFFYLSSFSPLSSSPSCLSSSLSSLPSSLLLLSFNPVVLGVFI